MNLRRIIVCMAALFSLMLPLKEVSAQVCLGKTFEWYGVDGSFCRGKLHN